MGQLTAPASMACSTYGEVITAASTRPSARAWGICGKGSATYSVFFAPASSISLRAPMRLMLESWTTATFLPERSFSDLMPLSLDATSALASRSGLTWPSIGETHLSGVPWAVALMSTGVVTKPNCAWPATREDTTGIGEAAFARFTLMPCLANMPFSIARKRTALGENGTMFTVTSVISALALPLPLALLSADDESPLLPQAAARAMTAASALTFRPVRTQSSVRCVLHYRE